MNIPDHKIFEAAAASDNKAIQEAYDKAMPNNADWWQQEYEPAPRPKFEAEDQPDYLSAGIDSIEVSESETTHRRFQKGYAWSSQLGMSIEGEFAVFQGATHHSAVLDALSVKYFRYVARQLIHEGRYPGAERCWKMCMGEGACLSRVSLNKCLNGYTWRQVGGELTKEEQQEAYRQTRSYNSKLKKDRP